MFSPLHVFHYLSMFLAYIIDIPKEGKDTKQSNNYRPISLLNSDLNIFTKILAQWLAPLLQNRIHYGQVMFMSGREARKRITITIDLLYKIQKDEQKCCLLATDADKAFDHANWYLMLHYARRDCSTEENVILDFKYI